MKTTTNSILEQDDGDSGSNFSVFFKGDDPLRCVDEVAKKANSTYSSRHCFAIRLNPRSPKTYTPKNLKNIVKCGRAIYAFFKNTKRIASGSCAKDGEAEKFAQEYRDFLDKHDRNGDGRVESGFDYPDRVDISGEDYA